MRLTVGKETKLRFVLAYGFHNIQNIMRSLGSSAKTPNDHSRKQGSTNKLRVSDWNPEDHDNGVVKPVRIGDKTEQFVTTNQKSPSIEPNQQGFSNQSTPIHFVEIMACPRGCRYGGGQILPKRRQDARQSVKEKSVDKGAAAATSDAVYVLPHEYPFLSFIYRYLIHLQSSYSSAVFTGGLAEAGLDKSCYQPVLVSTYGQYRSIIPMEQDADKAGFIALPALKW